MAQSSVSQVRTNPSGGEELRCGTAPTANWNDTQPLVSASPCGMRMRQRRRSVAAPTMPRSASCAIDHCASLLASWSGPCSWCCWMKLLLKLLILFISANFFLISLRGQKYFLIAQKFSKFFATFSLLSATISDFGED